MKRFTDEAGTKCEHERLLAQLRMRLERYRDHDDSTVILDPAAVAEAAALLREISNWSNRVTTSV
jgi:hypothetical protein